MHWTALGGLLEEVDLFVASKTRVLPVHQLDTVCYSTYRRDITITCTTNTFADPDSHCLFLHPAVTLPK